MLQCSDASQQLLIFRVLFQVMTSVTVCFLHASLKEEQVLLPWVLC